LKLGSGWIVYLVGNKNINGVGSTKREAIGDFVINYNLHHYGSGDGL
jgi:hypothetical protein